MKITIFLLFLCASVSAQNVISGTYAGNDNQFGLRYDKQYQRYGFYSGAGYGVYNDKYVGSVSHARISGGITRYVVNYASDDWMVYFSLGLSGHYYNQIKEGWNEVPKNALFPLSFDLGVGFVVSKRLSLGWTFDPLKKDVVFNLGYRFRK